MKQPEIYKQRTVRSVLKTVIKVLLILLLALAIIFIGLFYYLRRFVVYDENGAHLDFSPDREQTDTVIPQDGDNTAEP
ncbi:MAG: hypothetical protein IJ072_08170 [Oscillospiraceae bacterium]|nr:hypothetical protein [Oscillospiraceae bacterium]